MQINLVTFVFELVNFVVLAVLLQRFVYRPVAAAITDRRKEIADTRTEAKSRLEFVETRNKMLDKRDRELDQLRETIFAEATASAAAERAKLIEEAREDASAERARVQAMLDTEREAALGWVREVTIDQGVEVAGKLLLELVPAAAHDALVQRLLRALEAAAGQLPSAEVGEVVAAEATFAQVPPEETSNALKAALQEAVGGSVRLSFSVDERLGAGATLRVRDRVFDASVSGQLNLLREDARQLVQEAS